MPLLRQRLDDFVGEETFSYFARMCILCAVMDHRRHTEPLVSSRLGARRDGAMPSDCAPPRYCAPLPPPVIASAAKQSRAARNAFTGLSFGQHASPRRLRLLAMTDEKPPITVTGER